MLDTLVYLFNIIALYAQCLMIQRTMSLLNIRKIHKFTSQEDVIDKIRIETIIIENLMALRIGQGWIMER